MATAQTPAELRVEVRHEGTPVEGASVNAGALTGVTGPTGVVTLAVSPGAINIRVVKDGFVTISTTVTVGAGATQSVVVDLEESPELEEEVVVVASTRTGKRLEDQPLRVEVVPGEEVQEKIMMTPGDVSMLLNETNGLRVQSSSPSLGGASLRIQGLRGRYSHVLSDGLPLFGAQTGSIGLLQIPPMDLGQVEVIKGVASALYGMSAVGGVVNLVSRRPPDDGREGEILVNGTSHAGLDVVNWLAGAINDNWGYTFVGGVHTQGRSDLDDDAWTDLPSYRRVVARPRLFWDAGNGRSLLATVGVMTESRDGGTMPGGAAPDGGPFPETMDTNRWDGGVIGRFVTGGGLVVAARGSLTGQRSTRTLGAVGERERHDVSFGEVTVMGAAGAHTWVAGGAVSHDRFRATDVPRFDYSHTVPGAFVQDDFSPVEQVVVSGSIRVDAHSEYGTFVSPRMSLLFRPADEWSVRVTGGRGYSAPTPFMEEVDSTGLSPVAPLADFGAERATSGSADVTWTPGRFEVTLTAFRSRIDGALMLKDTPASMAYPLAIQPAAGPVLTHGTEFIARYHREGFDVVATHMWLASTEPDPLVVERRNVPLNPGHSASFDLLRQIGPARVGFEVFFTGSQALEPNPYRESGRPYVLFGGLVDWAVGASSRIFVNVENLGDFRQTKLAPFVLPVRDEAGRWTVDAWAPLEGRTINAGLRFRF